MSAFPTNKTVPLDKDIGVAGAKTQSINTPAREQLSVVLDALDAAIASTASSSSAAVSAEATARQNADTTLQTNINSEAATRLANDNSEAATRLANDNTEASTRSAADTVLQGEIDGERALLRMTAATSPTVTIGSALGTRQTDLTKLGLINSSLFSDYTGGTINFSTGVITGGGTNFTPVSFAGQASKWIKYGLVLLPGTPNTVLVLLGSVYGSTAALATEPAIDGGISIGYVAVQDNGTAGVGTINNIVQTNLTQLFASGSGSGSGSGSPLDIQESSFLYYTRSDFAVDKKKFFGSTTGSDSILGLKKVVLGVGQTFTSADLVGPQVKLDAPTINQIQAKILYNAGFVDEAATVQVSRDGGASYQTATVSYPGSANAAAYVGTLLEADYTYVASTTALLNGGTANGVLSSGTRLAAIITPAYRTSLTSFQMYLRTSATTGTVVGKIHAVSSGIPTTLLATSAETLVAAQDITSTAGYKQFSFTPITLEAGTSYALVVEGTSLDANLSADRVTSPASFDVSSATYSAGWSASGTSLAVTVFGTGLDLRLKITSGTALSELAGFGIDFVADTAQLTSGRFSYEERTITSTEASTGLITLNSMTYTPGMRQLRVFNSGHVYVSPDFTEIGISQVQFAAGFFNTGDLVKFQNSYGLVDGSSIAVAKITGMYDVILGSAAQVSAGVATHSTWAGAIVACPAGGSMFVLRGSITENVTLAKNIRIVGQGYASVLNGTFTMATGADFSTIMNLKFGGNVSIASNGSFVRDCFIAVAATLTDTGSGNSKLLVQG